MVELNAVEELEARAGTYGFLSALFLDAMGAEFLANVRDAGIVTGTRFDAFVDALRDPACDVEALRRDLAAEYNAVLLNMSASPVYPYESVYVSDTHLMRQDAHDEVCALMAQAGLAKDEELRIPADHVGIEFEFMGKLCAREAEALRACDAAGVAQAHALQEQFLREHLLVWTHWFLRDFAARVKSDAYAGLAELAAEHLAFEAEAFGVVWPPEQKLETPTAPEYTFKHKKTLPPEVVE